MLKMAASSFACG